ncbi:MAG: HAMP domain-containing protein [Planctomycetaceae bacterium]|nr:HAMP domain-containing protein [Planctomycetaceae bacterium]MCB9950728.1 HAMP domain-containing protein [Planctomycetaceae bacterium]
MLFTKSIRRKLAVVLLFFVGLLGLFIVVSLRGLQSHRATLDDLRISVVDTPSRDQLIARISSLIEPLSYRIPDESKSADRRQQAANWQHDQFAQQLAEVHAEIQHFEDKWSALPGNLQPSSGGVVTTSEFMRDLRRDLKEQLAGSAESLKDISDLRRRDRSIAEMLETIGGMIRRAETLPDPAYRLAHRLEEAQDSYAVQFQTLCWVGAFSLGMLIIILVWMYQLILAPIHNLMTGVKRVADGEFDYRLTTDTKCELSALAAAFNDMAERIETDRRDKKQQIEEGIQQLVLSERMASLGMLSTGVAHEINNPLMGIANAAVELQFIFNDYRSGMKEQDQEDAEHAIKVISDQTKNCQRITAKLKLFGQGKQGQERNLYDLTAILQEVVSLVQMLKQFPDRTIDLPQLETHRVWIDAGEIRQVVLNLVMNALQATTSGGLLSIHLHETPDFVEVEFQDDGCGMTPEQLKKAFDPFFTTKEVGKGTGLGLSLSRGIVLNHGGVLEASSEGEGKGATFVLRLPRTQSVAKRNTRAA